MIPVAKIQNFPASQGETSPSDTPCVHKRAFSADATKSSPPMSNTDLRPWKVHYKEMQKIEFDDKMLERPHWPQEITEYTFKQFLKP